VALLRETHRFPHLVEFAKHVDFQFKRGYTLGYFITPLLREQYRHMRIRPTLG
jgi:hypothetical protein